MIYGEWFREGKDKREDFFSKYDCRQDKLPANYKIEDLKYFTDLNVNIK